MPDTIRRYMPLFYDGQLITLYMDFDARLMCRQPRRPFTTAS